MNQKRTLFVVVSFSLVALLLNIIVDVTTDPASAQIENLLQSKYEYSVIAAHPSDQDNYYKFNAGISFATTVDSDKSMNVDIVMQARNTEYTDLISWNTNQLGTYDVAISRSASREYGISKGDKIYSKHVVSGNMCEYTVVDVLPEAVCVRESKTTNYAKGIVIMGYDDNYANNLSYANIIFTKAPIDGLNANATENIIYRDDEIKHNILAILPYFIVFSVLLIVLICVQELFLIKGLKHNFCRLASLGFGKKELDKSYRSVIGGSGIATIIFSSVLSAAIHRAMNLCTKGLVLIFVIAFLELISMIVMEKIQNNRLWRK
jgi:hypothetical protein